MNLLLQWLGFRCQHGRTTFPQTDKRKTYVVCLECGKEFPYSWDEMRVVLATEFKGGNYHERNQSTL